MNKRLALLILGELFFAIAALLDLEMYYASVVNWTPPENFYQPATNIACNKGNHMI